jgi:Zn-finger nucleic acid-binding protein
MTRTLNCVCDAHTALLPQTLAKGLPVLGCESCHGQLLSLDDYRRWLARYPQEMVQVPVKETAPPYASGAPSATSTPVRKCPACSQLMERLLSARASDFRLDRCGPCQWLWMDAGEWSTMVADNASRELLEILSDGGQRALRETAAQQRREIDLRVRHGDATIDELIRLRAWMAQQPHSDTLLNLLRSGW